MSIRVALTLDDAPTIVEPGIVADPTNMDAVRETLKSNGVGRCVAFVVARTAVGHEGALERWLGDGYELGNHTFDHCRASAVGVEHFVRSMRQCHELLERVGAFSNNRTAWFRFPYLSRGRNVAARSAIQTECKALGYRFAHASVDLCDQHFERKLANALDAQDAAMSAAIGARYEEVSLESMRFADMRIRRVLERAAPLVPYCHFGRISRRHLGGILRRLRSADVEFCSLEEALSDPLYQRFDEDPTQDGLVTHTLPNSMITRLGRRLARLSELVGIAEQSRLGPRWPYVR